MTDAPLTEPEVYLLAWLGVQDSSPLGECSGSKLDRLIELKLARIIETVQGRTIDQSYHRVSLTEAGHERLRAAARTLENT